MHSREEACGDESFFIIEERERVKRVLFLLHRQFSFADLPILEQLTTYRPFMQSWTRDTPEVKKNCKEK